MKLFTYGKESALCVRVPCAVVLKVHVLRSPQKCGQVHHFDKNAIDTSASLSDDGLDSVSLIKVIVDAEKEFDVAFDDRELALNKYENLNDVVELIEEKLQ